MVDILATKMYVWTTLKCNILKYLFLETKSHLKGYVTQIMKLNYLMYSCRKCYLFIVSTYTYCAKTNTVAWLKSPLLLKTDVNKQSECSIVWGGNRLKLKELN